MSVLLRLLVLFGFGLCFAFFIAVAAIALAFDAAAFVLAAIESGCAGLSDGFVDLADIAVGRGQKLKERLRASGWACPEQAREK